MPSTKLSLQKKLLFSLIATLLMLAALEGLARVTYAVLRGDRNGTEQRARTDWKTPSAELGWVPTPGFQGLVYGVPRQFDADGLLVQDGRQISDRTRPRIVFLGDSSTFGIKMPADNTFVELVDQQLPEASAINLAVIGYSSHQGIKVFERYLERDTPDVAVVSFNFNDRRSVLADDIDSAEKFQRIYTQSRTEEKFADLMDYSFLCRAARSIFKRLGWSSSLRDQQSDEGIHFRDVHPRVSAAAYRRNLERIVQLAARRNVAVIFMTLHDNPLETENLTRGVRYFEEGRYEDAIKELKVALKKDGINRVLARVYLAKSYEKKGRLAEAGQYAKLYGQSPSQAGRAPRIIDWQYNQIMLDVAGQDEIDVVDAGKILDEIPADYLDFCHPNAKGHRKIAAVLAPKLAELLASRRKVADPSGSPAPSQELETNRP